MKKKPPRKAGLENQPILNIRPATTAGCCGGPVIEVRDTGCCTGPAAPAPEPSSTPFNVTIDGRDVEVDPADTNIVDVATRAKIGIPAPCYRAKRSQGCCNGCVVEIDGEQRFACSTRPREGMNIVVNRADLKALRKQRLAAYVEGIKTGNPCECSGSDSGCCST